LFCSRDDTIRIPTIITHPPRIDQQRLVSGCHKQGCLATFDIDEKD
jgi:hypothetical protein